MKTGKAKIKCDGNHAGGRYSDLECWNDTDKPSFGGLAVTMVKRMV
jgi:hypothetical protein